MQRHRAARVGPGALVFPGGKTEPGDADPVWSRVILGDAGLSASARGRRICALRETFEEAGLLLAHHADGRVADNQDVSCLKADMAAEARGLAQALKRIGLRFDLSDLTPFSHWITPEAVAARFDTVFYLAAAPTEQAARADGTETVDARWMSPDAALKSALTPTMSIMFPTRSDLSRLRLAQTLEQALYEAKAQPPRPIQPRIIQKGGETIYLTEPAADYDLGRPPALI